MKLLYSKYSNDRALEYRIRTDIVELEDKSKAVIKRAVNNKSARHVNNMYHNYVELEKHFKDTKFSFNKAAICKDGVMFQFLEGESLEEILDTLVKYGRFEDFERIFQEYIDNLYKAAIYRFEISSEFVNVFGDEINNKDYYSLPITDIDIIFSNVYVQDDKWTIIDYEWTFDFLIPVKYVAFRTIYYYLLPRKELDIQKRVDLYGIADISVREIEIFLRAEWNFQHSIWGEYKSIVEIKSLFNAKKYYPIQLAEESYNFDERKRGQIVLYNGKEIINKYSFTPYTNDEGICRHQFELECPKANKVCIFPYDGSCSLTMSGVIAINGDNQELMNYRCNGQLIGDHKWACFHDCCVEVDGLPSDTSALYIEYKVCKESHRELMKFVLWQEQLDETIEGLKKEKEIYIQEIEKECKEKNDYKSRLDEITNSKKWKLINKLYR